jgi:hypothetical protein
MLHIFGNCNLVQNIWSVVKNFLIICGITLPCNAREIIIGISGSYIENQNTIQIFWTKLQFPNICSIFFLVSLHKFHNSASLSPHIYRNELTGNILCKLFIQIIQQESVKCHKQIGKWFKNFYSLSFCEQSNKGKVKTHNYINRQNQSTTGKLWKS